MGIGLGIEKRCLGCLCPVRGFLDVCRFSVISVVILIAINFQMLHIDLPIT
jgi:hypothetical protein